MADYPEVQTSFSVRQLARRHGMSFVTVYSEINAGRLKSFKVGRLRRISFGAEAKWVAEREAEATAKLA